MKKIVIILYLLSIGMNSVSAQSDFQSIIESEIVKDKLSFQIIGENLNISIDSKETKQMVSKLGLQGKSKQIVINSKFIHPLRYQVSLTNKLVEDELTKAAQEYFTQFTSYITSISNAGSYNSSGRSFSTAKTKTVIIKNPHLIELFALLNGSDQNFFSSSDAPVSTTELLNAMVAINDKEIEDHIVKSYEEMFENIWKIESYEEIKKSLESNKLILSKIEDSIGKISKSIDRLKAESSDFSTKYLIHSLTDITKNTVGLISSKIDQIDNDHKLFLKKKEDLDKKYSAFKTLLDNISIKTYGDDNKETRIDEIIFEKGKRNEVTIYLKIFDYDKKTKALTEKEQKTYTIYLRKHQTFLPVVASGVLYTNLSFETYGTETNDAGETLLTQGKSKDNEIAIGAYLNMYLNNGWSTPVFFQIGVGPSKEKPLLFTGFGLNLGSRISLSLGGVFTWVPTLDELNVGDLVTGTTQIEDDLIYKFTNSPKLYLGLSFDLTK